MQAGFIMYCVRVYLLAKQGEAIHVTCYLLSPNSVDLMSSWCYCIGTTGKGPQQKTVCVLLEKTAGRDPGFIFHETRYNNCGVRQ